MGAGGSHHVGGSYRVDERQREMWRQRKIKRQEIKERERKAKKAEQEAKKAERERVRRERGPAAETPWWQLAWWKQHALKWPWQWWKESRNEEGPAKMSRPAHLGRDYELLGVGNSESARAESTEDILKATGGMPHADGELRRRT